MINWVLLKLTHPLYHHLFEWVKMSTLLFPMCPLLCAVSCFRPTTLCLGPVRAAAQRICSQTASTPVTSTSQRRYEHMQTHVCTNCLHLLHISHSANQDFGQHWLDSITQYGVQCISLKLKLEIFGKKKVVCFLAKIYAMSMQKA